MRKIIVTILLLLLYALSFGQNIKLDYEPKGGVIKFFFNNLICYTDTSALFARHQSDTTLWETEKTLYREIDSIIRKHLMNNDTVVFTENFIDLSPDKRDSDWWRVWDDIRILTITNKVLLFDSHGNRVQKVQIRQKGRIRKCGGGRYFISKETKEVLFLYEQKMNQSVCTGEVDSY